MSKVTQQMVRIKTDGSLDACGDESDPLGEWLEEEVRAYDWVFMYTIMFVSEAGEFSCSFARKFKTSFTSHNTYIWYEPLFACYV